jgi:alpha-mannosidase
LTLRPPNGAALSLPDSRPVTLAFDTDVASRNDAREDGAFADGGVALAAELLPDEVTHRGVRYVLGSTETGADNAVTCRGQPISIAPQPGDRLYVLAAADVDVTATFRVGEAEQIVPVQAFTGFLGQWDSRVMADGKIEFDPAKYTPAFVKPAEVAWYGAHRHAAGQDEPYVFTYLFRLVLAIPSGATTLTLPDDPRIKVLAVTLANDPNGGTVAASVLHDGFDPLAHGLVPVYAEGPDRPDVVEGVDAAEAGAEVAEGDDSGSGGGGCQGTCRAPSAGAGLAWLVFSVVVGLAVRRYSVF